MLVPLKNQLANISLFALALFYIIMLGGGNYEQINITSIIASAPPKSLYMLQGPYAFSPMKFWVTFRPITILLFILTLAFNWKLSNHRKKLLMIAFAIDMTTTLATFTYFAPETGVIVGGMYDNSFDPVLQARAQLWKNLNLIRLGAFYIVSIMLLLAVNQNTQERKVVAEA